MSGKDTTWKPIEECLNTLMSMGIEKNAAERALLNTCNNSADLAAAWLFDNPTLTFPEVPVDADEIARILGTERKRLESKASKKERQVKQKEERNEECEEEGEEEEWEEGEEEMIPDSYDGPYKMVFVVNSELGMGVGKIAAQVAHAALGLNRLLLQKEEEMDAESDELGPLAFWEEYDGEKKICLKGESTQHLLDLKNQMSNSGLECYLVRDAGHTQVAAGSVTVLSGFGKECDLNKVTGKLKLL